MKNFIQEGDTLTLAAPAAVSSGDGMLVGSIFAVAAKDAASGEDVPARVTGVVELPKAADVIGQGARLYWDDTAKNVTTTATANTLIGAATEAAAGGAATVRVRLNGTV